MTEAEVRARFTPGSSRTGAAPETTGTVAPTPTSTAITPAPAAPTPPAETPPAGSDRESDRTPPVLDGMNFEPPRIDDGGQTRLVIRVHDDLSGVRAVTGNVRSPSGRAVFSFEAAPADASGTLYAANVTIPAKAETGSWYVGYLYIPDRADNPLIASYSAQNAPPDAVLNVVSNDSDATPPTFRGIVLTNPSVQGGARNHLRVDVEDDASGIASVVGSFQSPSGAALIPFICRLNAESGTWEGDVIVPQNADCGQWVVHQVLAVDKAGNSAVLQNPSPLIANVGFDVVSEGCDATAPSLDAFSLSPTVVSNEAPGEILVSASVSDAGSGATSLTGWASGPLSTNGTSPKMLFSCVLVNPSDPSSGWTGKIMVPQYAAKGTWRIARVRVQDRAQNVRDYTPADAVISGATFQVE